MQQLFFFSPSFSETNEDAYYAQTIVSVLIRLHYAPAYSHARSLIGLHIQLFLFIVDSHIISRPSTQ